MGISQPLYTIEIFQIGEWVFKDGKWSQLSEWREYVLDKQRYTMTDRKKLVALAHVIMPANVKWRVVEMKWEMAE